MSTAEPSFGKVEMVISPNEDKLFQLYEAARSGSVPTLSTLLESDPQILHRVSLSPYPETPLHISALAGHLDFSKDLLTRKPELASRLDSFKCSPLHLASAEGHLEIVRALLGKNKNVCLVPDAEGRIPLHLAAMRGKVDIIQDLYHAKPSLIHQKVNGNYTILHLCIQYNQLEALKLLVTLVNENQLLNSRDSGGNTILHLAVMLRQLESVRYLVSIPEIKTEVNALNRIGISALDVIDHSARDFKSLEIRDILSRAAADGEDNVHSFPTQQESVQPSTMLGGITSVYKKFLNSFKERSECGEERHEHFMFVATLIATNAFQLASNPPGGTWQQDYNETSAAACNKDFPCQAGTAVLAFEHPTAYLLIMICNTISFGASLSFVLLAVSGLPLKNKFSTWLLTIAMIGGITFSMVTYLVTTWAVAPHIYYLIITTIITSIGWVALVGLVAVFIVIRLFSWLPTVPCLRCSNKKQRSPTTPDSSIVESDQTHTLTVVPL